MIFVKANKMGWSTSLFNLPSFSTMNKLFCISSVAVAAAVPSDASSSHDHPVVHATPSGEHQIHDIADEAAKSINELWIDLQNNPEQLQKTLKTLGLNESQLRQVIKEAIQSEAEDPEAFQQAMVEAQAQIAELVGEEETPEEDVNEELPLGTEFSIAQVKTIVQDVANSNSEFSELNEEEMESIVKDTMPIINMVQEKMNAGDFEGALKQLNLYIDETIGAQDPETAQELKSTIAYMISHPEEANVAEEVEAKNDHGEMQQAMEHEMEAAMPMIQNVEELVSHGKVEEAEGVVAQFVDTHVDCTEAHGIKDLLEHPEQVQAMIESVEAFAETPEGENEMEEIVKAAGAVEKVIADSNQIPVPTSEPTSSADVLLPCMLTVVAFLTATLF